MEYIYQLAADIGDECRDFWLANYPDLSTFEHLTPCGAFEISYDEERHTPRVNIAHDSERQLPNITAAILRELPDIRDIEETYYEERREYYRAGYPEETTTNAEFYDMTNVR